MNCDILILSEKKKKDELTIFIDSLIHFLLLCPVGGCGWLEQGSLTSTRKKAGTKSILKAQPRKQD